MCRNFASELLNSGPRITTFLLVGVVGLLILAWIGHVAVNYTRSLAGIVRATAQQTANISDRLGSEERVVAQIRTDVAEVADRQVRDQQVKDQQVKDQQVKDQQAKDQQAKDQQVQGRRQMPRRRIPDLQGNSILVATPPTTDGPMLPVSMTRIGPHELLIANYRNIYLFDEDARTATPIKIDGDLPDWNPTAVFYSAFYDRVFIANYSGKDVLVAQLTRNGASVDLHLTERITNDEAIEGAEGVVISRGGRFMAVADYDGGALSVFERVDNQWLFRWRKPQLASHGVAIIGENVYSAGTTITKFAVETGAEIAKTTTIGSEPILFVTCLNEDESTGDLIGSDAITGTVFTMTRDLELKRRFGANGPTRANLSLPFCAYRDRRATYVLSTYQDRIVVITREGTTSYQFGRGGWDYLADQSAFRNEPDTYFGATPIDRPNYQMFGKSVRPSYDAIDMSDGKKLLMPARGQLFGGQEAFYLTSIVSNRDWLAIVANSSPRAILYNRKTGELGSAELGDWDCWAVATEVLCPSRRYSVADLASAVQMLDPKQVATLPGDSVGSVVPLLKYWQAWKEAQTSPTAGP